MSQPSEQGLDGLLGSDHMAVQGAVCSTQREHHHPEDVCRGCAGNRKWCHLVGGSAETRRGTWRSLDVKGLDKSLRSCSSL